MGDCNRLNASWQGLCGELEVEEATLDGATALPFVDHEGDPEVGAGIGRKKPVVGGAPGEKFDFVVVVVEDGEFEVLLVAAEAVGAGDGHVGEFKDRFGVADAERFEKKEVFIEVDVELAEVGDGEVFASAEEGGLVGEVEGVVELVD